MAITVVLTVGLDPWLLVAQNSAWRTAGYFAVSSSSIREAFQLFKAGDFDLILMGSAISLEERESLTLQIREIGAKVPVVDNADLSDDYASVEKSVGRTAVNPFQRIDLIGAAKGWNKPEVNYSKNWYAHKN